MLEGGGAEGRDVLGRVERVGRLVAEPGLSQSAGDLGELRSGAHPVGLIKD